MLFFDYSKNNNCLLFLFQIIISHYLDIFSSCISLKPRSSYPVFYPLLCLQINFSRSKRRTGSANSSLRPAQDAALFSLCLQFDVLTIKRTLPSFHLKSVPTAHTLSQTVSVCLALTCYNIFYKILFCIRARNWKLQINHPLKNTLNLEIRHP